MTLNHWYVQRFHDQHLFFLPRSEQKNGGYKGILVTQNLGSRARPKATHSSASSGPRGTAAHWSALWKYIDTDQVPQSVRDSAASK